MHVQPRTKVLIHSFALPNQITNLEWTIVLTLWNADLTFKVASKKNIRLTFLWQFLLDISPFQVLFLKKNLC